MDAVICSLCTPVMLFRSCCSWLSVGGGVFKVARSQVAPPVVVFQVARLQQTRLLTARQRMAKTKKDKQKMEADSPSLPESVSCTVPYFSIRFGISVTVSCFSTKVYLSSNLSYTFSCHCFIHQLVCLLPVLCQLSFVLSCHCSLGRG